MNSRHLNVILVAKQWSLKLETGAQKCGSVDAQTQNWGMKAVQFWETPFSLTFLIIGQSP